MATRRLDQVTPAEIREVALTVVTEEGTVEGWRAADLAATKVGGDLNSADSLGVRSLNYHREMSVARLKWNARVRRALDTLAAEGVIVKFGKGQPTPAGHNTDSIWYYTHEKVTEAREAAAEARKTASATRARWDAVTRRLEQGANEALGKDGALSLEAWERLLDKAGW